MRLQGYLLVQAPSPQRYLLEQARIGVPQTWHTAIIWCRLVSTLIMLTLISEHYSLEAENICSRAGVLAGAHCRAQCAQHGLGSQACHHGNFVQGAKIDN